MTLLDVTDPRLRFREPSRTAKGGTGLVGRRYLLGAQVVTVEIGWGPGATVRNVGLRLADGTFTVRPFRGLRRIPAHLPANPNGER